jgi:DNA mismatch endonuclease (patch repair protein)
MLPKGGFTNTSPARSALMASIRSTGTKPELRVRRFLHERGYRYRVDVRQLPGRPDVVFTKKRKIVLVHGCFWHGHDCPLGLRDPKTNREYWRAKIAGNAKRDARNVRVLRNDRWQLISLWECDVMGASSREEWKDRLLKFLGAPRADPNTESK